MNALIASEHAIYCGGLPIPVFLLLLVPIVLLFILPIMVLPHFVHGGVVGSVDVLALRAHLARAPAHCIHKSGIFRKFVYIL